MKTLYLTNILIIFHADSPCHCFFTLITIFGGIHRIARVAGIIVPFMAIAYILVALFILFNHMTAIPALIGHIFSNAFGIEQVVGGGLGATIMQGVRRGLFSNEAGMGSAPNAAAIATIVNTLNKLFFIIIVIKLLIKK